MKPLRIEILLVFGDRVDQEFLFWKEENPGRNCNDATTGRKSILMWNSNEKSTQHTCRSVYIVHPISYQSQQVEYFIMYFAINFAILIFISSKLLLKFMIDGST